MTPRRPRSRVRLLRLAGWVVFAAGVAITGGAAPSEPAPRWSRPLAERQPLVVGVTSDSFPYGYLDADGSWRGFAVDITDAVARVMNLRIERVSAPGRELHQRFRDGEFDLLQAYSQTPEREEFAEFTVPYLTLQGAVFVRKVGNPIQRLEDLNGRRFAVIGTGSIGEKFLRDHNLKVEAVYVSSSEEALLLLERGDCVATFMSVLTGLSVAERRGLEGSAVFGRPFEDYDIRHCLAVHRGDGRLLARLNEGLAILHRTGEFQQIYQRWFGRFDQPLIPRETLVAWGLGVLAVGFLAALAAFLRQRALHGRIARQAALLSRQQNLLQALYDNIPLGMCVLEREGTGHRVLSLNRQAEPHVGLRAEAAVGRLLSELPLDPEWGRHLHDLLGRVPHQTGFLREEVSLARLRRRIVFTLVPLAAGPGQGDRLCVLEEDVTERRHLDDEIAQSRRLRAVGELVGGIAHEFNNLLTPIMLKTGEIQLDWPEDRKLHAELALITGAVQRAAELTRRLLAFGRKSEPKIETAHLASVVESCFALMRMMIDRRIQWENAVPPSLPAIRVNVTDLNQVLANLVLNARDTLLDKLAQHRGDWTPVIRVEAAALPADAATPTAAPRPGAEPAGWQRLTVRDNGMGISPEVQERIFEPFFTTKEVGRGTGLGLATVWHLVTEAGGRVEVESVPGEGTSFHIFLPATAGDTAVSPPTPAPGPLAAGRGRVFLADDDEFVAGTVQAALRRFGCTVHRVADGRAAWQELQTRHGEFELLILDINMPGLDGIELAQRIRRDLGYNGRLMVISGRLSSNDLRQIGEARADAVLSKPFDLHEFLDRVHTCLGSEPDCAAPG